MAPKPSRISPPPAWPMQVTAENYHDKSINMAYMSASQFKAFMACEAAALAELRGEYSRETTTALLVGSYVDAYFSRDLTTFTAQHPAIFTRQGELKAEYRKADAIIARIERDRLFMLFMGGAKQVIKTGEIAGVTFKAKFDSLLDKALCQQIMFEFPALAEQLMFADGAINDLKIMRDFDPIWKTGEGKISFIEAWGYDLQGAIYQEIDGGHKPFFITAASKQDTPDIELFHVPQDALDAKLMLVQELAPRFAAIKRGEIEPDRCGKCAYCRSVKVLTEAQDYRYYGETEEAV